MQALNGSHYKDPAHIWLALWAVAAILAVVAFAPAARASMLTVSPDGVLLLEGKPYRGIGVNIADAFHRLYLHPGDFTYDRDFATLEAEGIPFARIPATAYAPHDVRDYVLHRDAYLEKLDGVIQSAEKHHIGLILDLFWWHVAVPDIVQEPGSAWGDPDSRTIAFMREYTQTIVSRYHDSPSVWAWEFGNEFSLAADLPNAADWRPQINAIIGWPDKRTEADDIRTPMILVAFSEFAKAVREIDPDAAITTGNSIPRPNAESQRKTLTWDSVDTEADFRANLAMVNPDPMNMLQIHLYAFDLKRFRQSHVTYDDIIEQAMRVAREQKKPLFIGEMSSATVWPELKTEDDVERDFKARLDAILEHKVPLSAVWQVSTSLTFANDPLSISRDKDNGWMFDDIRAANNQIAAELKAEQRISELVPQFEAAIGTVDLGAIVGLQQLLVDRGYKPGAIDGQYGPSTKRALTACIAAGTCTRDDLPPPN